MPASKTYSEKLLDPRWQKRRLEILERDHFRCCECKADDKTLHVHHLWYGPKNNGKNVWEIWEVPDHWLATLCDKCHKERHDAEDRLRAILASYSMLDLTRIVEFLGGEDGPMSSEIHENIFIMDLIARGRKWWPCLEEKFEKVKDEYSHRLLRLDLKEVK